MSNTLTDEQIDAIWDASTPQGGGRSRYDIARDLIAAAATTAEPPMDVQVDMLQSWLDDAERRSEFLQQHLNAVLEVAGCWQPDYATAMDLATLRHAQEAIADPSAARQAEARDALREVERLLTNLQPIIPQACYPGREKFIDNYVDPALEILRAALSAQEGKP